MATTSTAQPPRMRFTILRSGRRSNVCDELAPGRSPDRLARLGQALVDHLCWLTHGLSFAQLFPKGRFEGRTKDCTCGVRAPLASIGTPHNSSGSRPFMCFRITPIDRRGTCCAGTGSGVAIPARSTDYQTSLASRLHSPLGALLMSAVCVELRRSFFPEQVAVV
jgi:hypothetical protein